MKEEILDNESVKEANENLWIVGIIRMLFIAMYIYGNTLSIKQGKYIESIFNQKDELLSGYNLGVIMGGIVIILYAYYHIKKGINELRNENSFSNKGLQIFVIIFSIIVFLLMIIVVILREGNYSINGWGMIFITLILLMILTFFDIKSYRKNRT